MQKAFLLMITYKGQWTCICWGFWTDRAVALSLSMLIIECVTRYLLTSVSLLITVH